MPVVGICYPDIERAEDTSSNTKLRRFHQQIEFGVKIINKRDYDHLQYITAAIPEGVGRGIIPRAGDSHD